MSFLFPVVILNLLGGQCVIMYTPLTPHPPTIVSIVFLPFLMGIVMTGSFSLSLSLPPSLLIPPSPPLFAVTAGWNS